MITAQNIDYYIAGRKIIDSVSFRLAEKQKIGLVGRNGSGKSTLFRLLLSELERDSGDLTIPQDIKIGWVQQHIPDTDMPVLDYVIASDAERTQLMQKLETTEDPNLLGDIYERLIHIDAYTAEARAGEILKGLGFDKDMQARPLKHYSGGWRMRVALAAALFQSPDLLLLDEPTNHLDFETSTWLEGFLKTYPRAILLISHERDFVNGIVDGIFHLKKGQLKYYKGNYDTFETNYKAQLAADASYNRRIESQRQHLQSFVDRFRAKASKAAQAQSRIKMMEKLNPIQMTPEDPTVKFAFSTADVLAPPMVRFEGLTLGYGEHEVLKNLKGGLNPEERIALLGANGNGKSTFVKFLAGKLQPLKGNVYISDKIRVGYFDQHQYETLDQTATPYQIIHRLNPDIGDTKIRAHLGRFGFNTDMVSRQLSSLSGGEKVRLVFCGLCIDSPNLLILDEPTNHLDIEMRDSLALALNEFSGAVVLVSHDAHLINAVADELWVVSNQKVTQFRGNLSEYRASI
ncbi:MAG: ABC-F family ATP-binding cassette domain-containing protein [Alphaproteobacteria bacterium]|nr:MAG: ABC-F family ATP-binding cassette domain-containing protein [Alphaproteobacteria bacterium]